MSNHSYCAKSSNNPETIINDYVADKDHDVFYSSGTCTLILGNDNDRFIQVPKAVIDNFMTSFVHINFEEQNLFNFSDVHENHSSVHDHSYSKIYKSKRKNIKQKNSSLRNHTMLDKNFKKQIQDIPKYTSCCCRKFLFSDHYLQVKRVIMNCIFL